jgi:hypothetical protein
LFALVLGAVIALAVELLLAEEATLGARFAYASVDTPATFHFFGVDTWYITIILSTITGAGSIGFGSNPDISYIMGGISILVSIISTLNSYFTFAKRSEAHRITSVSYNKLYLQISIELSLPRKKRLNVKEFMKSVSEQIVRLNEIQPSIPDVVIKDFKKTFKKYYDTDISLPETVNGLVSIKICDDIILTTEKKDEETLFALSPPVVSIDITGASKETPKKPVFR